MTNREQVVHFLTFVPAPGTNEAKPSDERKCDDMGRNWEAAGGFPRGDVPGLRLALDGRVLARN